MANMSEHEARAVDLSALATAAAPSAPPYRRIKEWLAANLIAAVPLAGLMIYVVLRLPYSIYYAMLNTTPEDVGLDYIELLSKSTLGILVVAGAILALTLAATCMTILPVMLFSIPTANFRAWRRRSAAAARETLKSFLVADIYATVFTIGSILFIAMPSIAVIEAHEVMKCHESIAGKSGLFDLRGEAATVEGVGSKAALLPKGSTFLLGVSGDKFVFYNCKSHQAVTVENQDGIVVSVGE